MSKFILNISLKNPNIFQIDYNSNNKFFSDKIYYEDEEYFLILDGIILNKKGLLVKNELSWTEFIINKYKNNGNRFFYQLKGSYYGFLLDKKQNKWIIFNDHISSKPLYFTNYEGQICFSNNYCELVNYLKQKNQRVTLNEQAAYLLLSYGYVFEDITMTNEIKRLMVGYYATIFKNKLSFEKFFTLTNNPINISEQDAIEEIDSHFRKAVQLAFEKDKEYDYKHVATLSGGLDSRMTIWVAHDLGYTDQLNLTFSQSNYLDETIAKQIASNIEHEWLFKALDNGSFLKKIDEISHITGGNVLYYGLAHSISLYQYIDFNNLGILHTGQLGDVIISTFYTSTDVNKQYKFGDGAYSMKFLSLLMPFTFKEDYANEEIFKMYIRGFYGANQGLLAAMEFTETYSPFYDIDFMQFALSIPLKFRYDHYLYKKWINIKYPEAAKYVWEKVKVPVNYPYWIKIRGKKVPLNQLPVKLASRLGFAKYGINTKNNMNPLEYWYCTNQKLKMFMDNYFQKNIGLLSYYPQLQSDCQKLYMEGKGTEKIQALSLLSSSKILF